MSKVERQANAETAAHDHTGRIGASRAPAILGLDPYTSPYDAWLEIKGEREDDGTLHEAAHWGTVLEDIVVRQGYEPRTGMKTQRVNQTLRHPDAPFITCHLDRRVIPTSTQATVQVKCRDRFVRDKWGAANTSDIPSKEAAQGMVEIEIANAVLPGGVTREDFAVLFGGNTFEIFPLHRDEKHGPEIIEVLAHWWHVHIDGDRAPDAETMRDCQKKWSKPVGDHRELTLETKELLAAFITAEESGKSADGIKQDARLGLMKAIGDHQCLTAEGKPIVSWRMVKAFDSEAFLREQSEIAKQCSKLDLASLKTEHPKLHELYLRKEKRGNMTVNRNAARRLLNK